MLKEDLVALLERLRHPRIVLLLGCTTHNRQLAMVLEWIERGSLYALLHGANESDSPAVEPLSLIEKLRIAKDVADGMYFLHQAGILHKDLKSPNMLVGEGRAKITDFGSSRSLDTLPSCGVTKTGSTPRWMAPEGHLGLFNPAAFCLLFA